MEGGKTSQPDLRVEIWAIQLLCRVRTNNITTMYSHLVLAPFFIQGHHIPTIYHSLLVFHQRTSPCCWLTCVVFHFVSGCSKACTQSIVSSCTTFVTPLGLVSGNNCEWLVSYWNASPLPYMDENWKWASILSALSSSPVCHVKSVVVSSMPKGITLLSLMRVYFTLISDGRLKQDTCLDLLQFSWDIVVLRKIFHCSRDLDKFALQKHQIQCDNFHACSVPFWSELVFVKMTKKKASGIMPLITTRVCAT